MIPGGWNSQSEASITQYDPDPFEHTMEGKKKNLSGWNSPRMATNVQCDPDPVEGAITEKDMIPGE